MGTWGVGLYENDAAQDMLIAFHEYKLKYKTLEEVLNHIQEDFKEELSDKQEGPILLAVLADLLQKDGVQECDAITKTVSWINQGGDAITWGDPLGKEYALRKKELQNLRERIESSEVRFSKEATSKRNQWHWNPGEVFALQLTGEYANSIGKTGHYLLFIPKGSSGTFNGYKIAQVHVKITEDTALPINAEQINRLPFVIYKLTHYSDRFRPFSCEEEIPTMYRQEYHCDEFGYLHGYTVEMLQSRDSHPPKELFSLGIFYDLREPVGDYHTYKVPNTVAWKYAEKILLERYWMFNLKNAPFLNGK